MSVRLVEGHNAYKGTEVPYTLQRNADGVPDFTTVDRARVRKCLERRLCGICGQRIGATLAFVGGSTATKFIDPPNHPTCAARAFSACPFLKTGRVRPDLPDSGDYGAWIAYRYKWDRDTLQSWPVGPTQFGKISERGSDDGNQ